MPIDVCPDPECYEPAYACAAHPELAETYPSEELHWEVREATEKHDGHTGMVGYYLMYIDGQEYGFRVDMHIKGEGIDKVQEALHYMRDNEPLARQMFDTAKEADDAQH